MYFVYLLANKPYGTLYVGLTSDLPRRMWEHKNKAAPGFTAIYAIDRLVWFEAHDNHEAALRREKQIKGWKRDWKINLIETSNQRWVNLYRWLRSAIGIGCVVAGIPAFAGMVLWDGESRHDRVDIPR